MTLIKELIEIPTSVQRGDFVLRLAEGVLHPEETLRDYVVTPELAAHFDDALTFIQSALSSKTSKASYLHGSFGSGKSHFMAVLNLLLHGNAQARSIPELAGVVVKHNAWTPGRKFLLVPYHMIGAPNMEAGILGGYVEFVRRVHPEAPVPGVYLAEGLFQDAGRLRQQMGDAAFFAGLNESGDEADGWGELAAAWDAGRFAAAVAAPPGAEERSQLIGALVNGYFGSYAAQVGGRGEAFLSLDQGLSVISRHAQTLGYDAVILFLDELILWLASHAGDLRFVQQEGQKLAKLVEAQTADRPVPIISFVARQRDLRELNGERLAALNHGSIRTPIPGREAHEVLRRCREWAAAVGEIRVSDEPNPTISVHLSGVDTETIIAQARGEDNIGNRIRRVRQILYEQLAIQGQDTLEQYRDIQWRNTKRTCTVLFGNVRDLPITSLENEGAEGRWKLVIDYPFDEAGHGPRDDLSKLQEFRATHTGRARTLCWLPSFLSQDALKELGLLVILDHILAGMRYEQYTVHLSPQDRQAAKALLENQQATLTLRVKNHIEAAYGLSAVTPNSLDAALRLEPHDQFVSLDPGFDLRPPVAPTLAQAMEDLLQQALVYEYPAAPEFEADVRTGNLNKVLPVLVEAAQSQDGRVAVDRSLRLLVRQIANPLLLGEMGADATHFVFGRHWKTHFHREQAKTNSPLTVGNLRRWLDEPRPMGLPREVQNLVIRVFAEQTGRAFYRHNVAIEPSLANLFDDTELREPHLPDATQWELAVPRAARLFGLSLSPLRNAANADTFAAQVRESATTVRTPCQNYYNRLCDRLHGLAIPHGTAPRAQTAAAVVELLERICERNADPVNVVATACIATSEAAMQECIQRASALAKSLSEAHWNLFESMGRLMDDRQADALMVLDEVKRALSSDEHVEALQPALAAADARAVRLLTQSAPPASSSPNPPPPNAPQTAVVTRRDAMPPSVAANGPRPIRSGAQEALAAEAALQLIAGLMAEVRAGQRLSLDVRWAIEEVSALPDVAEAATTDAEGHR